MEIKVEREHIDNGYRQGCTSCPIALAANQSLEKMGFWNATANVTADYISIHSFEVRASRTVPGKFHAIIGDELLFLSLPGVAKEFIMDFDSGAFKRSELEPFSFELPLEVLNELSLRI